MKKAQSRGGHCYTDWFKATYHFIVAKARKLQVHHYNKGHRIPMARGNDARVLALAKAVRASNTFQSSAPQERILQFPDKSLKNAT